MLTDRKLQREGQRVHEEDLVDYLLEQGGFEVLNLPAIAQSDASYELGAGGVHAISGLKTRAPRSHYQQLGYRANRGRKRGLFRRRGIVVPRGNLLRA